MIRSTIVPMYYKDYFVNFAPEPKKDALIQFGRERIAHYKIPKRFYLAQSWHTTASGKTQRKPFLAELERLKELI